MAMLRDIANMQYVALAEIFKLVSHEANANNLISLAFIAHMILKH